MHGAIPARLARAPLHLKLLGAFVLVLAVCAGQSVLAYRTAVDDASTEDWLRHTDEVLTLSSSAQTALFRTEAGYRGFLLTGHKAFLESYQAGAQAYATDLAALELLTADNPPQVARWQDLELRGTAWQQEVTEPSMALRRAGTAGASDQNMLAVADAGLGQGYVDDMLHVFDEATDVERSLLVQRDAQNSLTSARLMGVLLWGTLTTLGVGLLVAMLFARHLGRALAQVRAGERELRISERRYRQIFARSPAIKLLIDPSSGEIIEANQAAVDFYGFPEEDLLRLGVSAFSTLAPDTLATTMARLATTQGESIETRQRLASGEMRDVENRTNSIEDGRGRMLLHVIVQDITERKQAEEALRHQALHDALTDLPNRTLLHDRLSQAILSGDRENTPVALLLIDLDRFKEVNDTFGHHYGDLLLKDIGRRLRGMLRSSDTVARLGGDEFAVLLPGTDAAGAVPIARHLLRAFEQPFVLEHHLVEVSGSIGVVACPTHGNDAGILLRRADVAMYVAKREHSGLAVYAPELDQYSPDRLALSGELRQAIDQNELFLQYQPKVDLSGSLVGVEALVRWQHPRRGTVPPDEFIGLAEHVGLIKPLTRWVLDSALKQCRVWLDNGCAIPVAVNVSMHDLHDSTLPETIAELLVSHRVAAEYLRIEITEGAVMSDAGRAMDVLARVRGLGVGISVDDFGTGYSSLAYLKKLPVDELKIDRSFVRNLATDGEDASIVRSTIALGQELGLSVIAEGVEDQASWDRLKEFGCDLVQGYFVARPLSAADLDCWLAESQQSQDSLKAA